MPAERLPTTLADYIVLALNPALVMGMVGSLVFFLLEILYAGQYDGRLRLILFCFIVAVVLITRIALTTEIAERAGLYGFLLGILVYLGMQRFVTYEGAAHVGWLINLGLMAVVWWSAHRLTKDCTHLENDAEIGSEGLLDAAGLEEKRVTASDDPEEESDKPGTFLERYRRHRDQARKKRTPGVWVVYFSLAALPLFGLGQALVPVDASDRRQYTFLLLCLYVACGLGLLLTTAFLGLRRYLRQRGARMPAAMTGSWLALGVALIVAFLGIAAVVPRPLAEYSVINFHPAGSKTKDASKQGTGTDGEDKSKGKPVVDKKDAEKDGQGNSDKQKKKDRGSAPQAKGKDGGSKKDAEDKSQGEQKQDSGRENSKNGDESSNQPAKPFQFGEVFRRLASVLKWVVFALLAMVVVIYLFRAGLQFFANFTDWARRWLDVWNAFWNRLFGSSRKGTMRVDEAQAREAAPVPFAAYSNPFSDGRAAHMTPRELTIVSFLALEAWTTERNLGRETGETPLEFTRRVAAESPAIETEVLRLGNLYARAAYAPGALPEDSVEHLEQFWQTLDEIGERSVMASTIV